MTQTFQIDEEEWMSFRGGELEGKRPRTLCAACLARSARDATLCFYCYRADLDRERALRAAGQSDRWQWLLPLEPVNKRRLEMLKTERMAARAAAQSGGRFAEKRRQAQIAARHALQRIASDPSSGQLASGDRERMMASAIHAAEIQLPESWLPFVVSR